MLLRLIAEAAVSSTIHDLLRMADRRGASSSIDDIGEPSADELAELEREMGEWERPEVIKVGRFSLNKETYESLAAISAAKIIDYQLFKDHVPFIWVGESVGGDGGLKVGERMSFHHSITRADPEAEVVYNSHEGGLVGRVGIGFDGYKYDNALPVDGLELVAVYATDDAHEYLGEACGQLIEDGLVSRDALVAFAGQLKPIGEVATFEAADEEQVRRGKLQVALHLGAWPDGRRLSAPERDQIRRELGIVGGPMKSRWQSELERVGAVHPGQRWWAMHSEDVG